MDVDFIGMIGHRQGSETYRPTGPVVDKDWIRRAARVHDEGGFDRILIGYWSDGPDGFLIAQYAASQTERVGLMLAHRPGFVAPTLAARKLATLDHFSDGRLAVHVISGGEDADQRRDGDFFGHDVRYARTDEYVQILKDIWANDEPIDHSGTYYEFQRAFSTVKPLQKPRIPIYFGGSSDAAIRVAGRHADVYALWGESLDQVRDTIARVRAAARTHGRTVRFSLSLRPILGATEAKAWERAEAILEKAKALRGDKPARVPENEGSKRLLAAARRGKVVDKRLWTEIAAVTGAHGNSTSLVGTPEQVAESLFDYYDLGITTFLIRGFHPIDDAEEYGRELIPLFRTELRRREAALSLAAR